MHQHVHIVNRFLLFFYLAISVYCTHFLFVCEVFC